MIDAKAFGEELALIVKSACAPLAARIEALEKQIAEAPTPAKGDDGRSVTVEDVAPLIEDLVAKAVAAIQPAKDGVGLAGALIDRGGNLILTMSNGETKDLGVVVGSDGKDAEPVAGADGLGFEDMAFEERDGRLYAVFRRGDVVKEARMPTMSYRGTWADGAYLKGDNVTWAGSTFTAMTDTSSKPETDDTWRLSAKRGRDGKPAKGAL